MDVSAAFRSIAVISTQSPARVAAMASVLEDCIARHGWSERLGIEPAGYRKGAGNVARTDLRTLAKAGLGETSREYPDAEADPAHLAHVHCVVVGSEDEAHLLLQWPGAQGKQVFAFGDYVDDMRTAIDDPEAELSAFCEQIAEVASLLLRSLVAVD